MTLQRLGRLLVVAALLCVAGWASGADSLLLKAKGLLDGGNAQAAYELLHPLESERAGEPEFDYLLGVAALEIGRNTEAVFALERVLAVQPNSAPARAQIARAYFNLKETDTAKREFESVKSQDVPPEVKATIDRYLSAIDRIAEAETLSARFFLEFAWGYDSNVNSATSVAGVAVPGLGGTVLRLTPDSLEQDDGFFNAAAGLNLANPVTKTLSVIGGLAGYGRANFTKDDFDTGYIDGYVGLAKKAGRSTFSLIGQGNIFTVADSIYSQSYRNALGGTLQWTYDHDARNQFTAYAQYAWLTYPEQSPRDADRIVGGVGYAHASRGGAYALYAGLYGGAEITRDAAFDYLGFNLLGARFGGQTRINDRTYLFGNVAAEWRKYQGTDPFFLVAREDKQYSAGVGVNYLLANEWRLSPQATYLLNDSNLSISDYDRWLVFVSLRRDW